jgi:hypothetical protein
VRTAQAGPTLSCIADALVLLDAAALALDLHPPEGDVWIFGHYAVRSNATL